MNASNIRFIAKRRAKTVWISSMMTVRPGLGGQQFMPEVLKKIAHLRSRITALDIPLHIEVDGGINAETGARCRKAGADYLVAGSYVLCSDDPAEAVRSLKTPL